MESLYANSYLSDSDAFISDSCITSISESSIARLGCHTRVEYICTLAVFLAHYCFLCNKESECRAADIVFEHCGGEEVSSLLPLWGAFLYVSWV